MRSSHRNNPICHLRIIHFPNFISPHSRAIHYILALHGYFLARQSILEHHTRNPALSLNQLRHNRFIENIGRSEVEFGMGHRRCQQYGHIHLTIIELAILIDHSRTKFIRDKGRNRAQIISAGEVGEVEGDSCRGFVEYPVDHVVGYRPDVVVQAPEAVLARDYDLDFVVHVRGVVDHVGAFLQRLLYEVELLDAAGNGCPAELEHLLQVSDPTVNQLC